MTIIYIPRSVANAMSTEPDFVERALFIGITPMMINRYVSDHSDISRIRREQICEDAEALGYGASPIDFIQL